MNLTTQLPLKGRLETYLGYILVVDDTADNCFLLKTILEAEGYTVEVANNGETALAKAEARPPKLMLLDVMMPDMNGYEVTQRIRQNAKLLDLPVVLITAHDQESAAMGKAAGATGFIRKPFDFDELIRQVRMHAS